MFRKLRNPALKREILNVIQVIYSRCQCCVRLNGYCSEWFAVENGLKQGCLFSTILFSIYINDLAKVSKILTMELTKEVILYQFCFTRTISCFLQKLKGIYNVCCIVSVTCVINGIYLLTVKSPKLSTLGRCHSQESVPYLPVVRMFWKLCLSIVPWFNSVRAFGL